MTPEENKTFVRQSNERLYNQRRLEALDEDFALGNSAAYGQTLREFFLAFPDLQMTIERLITEGDVVGCQMT